MGRKPKHDWERAFELFNQAKFNNPKLTSKEWCITNGFDPTTFCKHLSKYRKKPLDPKQFAVIKEAAKEIAKQEVAELRKDARDILKNAAPEAAERLITLSKLADDEGVALRASTGILDRADCGPNAAPVNVNVQIPVLIAGVSPDQIKNMLGA